MKTIPPSPSTCSNGGPNLKFLGGNEKYVVTEVYNFDDASPTHLKEFPTHFSGLNKSTTSTIFVFLLTQFLVENKKNPIFVYPMFF